MATRKVVFPVCHASRKKTEIDPIMGFGTHPWLDAQGFFATRILWRTLNLSVHNLLSDEMKVRGR